jgi:hypothetical protein
MKSSVTGSTEDIIAMTRLWLERAVIGLNLCPFAKAVHVKNQIRYMVSDATTPEALLKDLACELRILDASNSVDIDTTLLIHPYVLSEFLDFNDFLGNADTVLEEHGLSGQIQIASFHPHYQFAGTEPDDIENFTNRSPYPILHLLRENSVEIAVAAFPDASIIFDKNIETMHRIGHEGWRQLGLTIPNLSSPPRDRKTK